MGLTRPTALKVLHFAFFEFFWHNASIKIFSGDVNLSCKAFVITMH